jgi:hypothetical protein
MDAVKRKEQLRNFKSAERHDRSITLGEIRWLVEQSKGLSDNSMFLIGDVRESPTYKKLSYCHLVAVEQIVREEDFNSGLT